MQGRQSFLVACVRTEPSVDRVLRTHQTQPDVAPKYRTHRTQYPGTESQDVMPLYLTQYGFLLMYPDS